MTEPKFSDTLKLKAMAFDVLNACSGVFPEIFSSNSCVPIKHPHSMLLSIMMGRFPTRGKGRWSDARAFLPHTTTNSPQPRKAHSSLPITLPSQYPSKAHQIREHPNFQRHNPMPTSYSFAANTSDIHTHVHALV
jgi:hypothetical protein